MRILISVGADRVSTVENLILGFRDQIGLSEALHVSVGKDLINPETNKIDVYLAPESARGTVFFRAVESALRNFEGSFGLSYLN